MQPLHSELRITDALISLHWLRVPERIQYKVALLSYKVLHNTVPQYLGPLTCVADIPGQRTLCSASTNCLDVIVVISGMQL